MPVILTPDHCRTFLLFAGLIRQLPEDVRSVLDASEWRALDELVQFVQVNRSSE